MHRVLLCYITSCIRQPRHQRTYENGKFGLAQFWRGQSFVVRGCGRIVHRWFGSPNQALGGVLELLEKVRCRRMCIL